MGGCFGSAAPLLAHVQCRAAVCLPLPLRPASQSSIAALQPDPVATEPLHSPLVESNDLLDCLSPPLIG
jgi:hypothetical protein